MVFEIKRVSAWWETAMPELPCKNSYVIDRKPGTVEDGIQLYHYEYGISINTLEEMMELQREVGRIILYSDRITIFDDHIE